MFVQLGNENSGESTHWILDTGATNHMTGARSDFFELDTGVRGTVKFGDSSIVNIEGHGTVLVNLKNGDHNALTGVYHIPRLTTNIISIGQLDEEGFKILIEGGLLKIWDVQRRLLVKISRTGNCLYVLNIDVAKPICLAVQGGDAAWR